MCLVLLELLALQRIDRSADYLVFEVELPDVVEACRKAQLDEALSISLEEEGGSFYQYL